MAHGNSEFDLHIWKQRAEGGRPDRYTVGVWQNGRILPLCHVQPLNNAVAAIQNALLQAGAQVIPPAPARKHNKSILSSLLRAIF